VTIQDPDGAYDWRHHSVSWPEIKVAAVLATTLLLAALLLF